MTLALLLAAVMGGYGYEAPVIQFGGLEPGAVYYVEPHDGIRRSVYTNGEGVAAIPMPHAYQFPHLDGQPPFIEGKALPPIKIGLRMRGK